MVHLDSSGMTPNTNAHWLTVPSVFSLFIPSSSFKITKPPKSPLCSYSLYSSSFQLPYYVTSEIYRRTQSGIPCLHKTALTFLLFNKHFHYRLLQRFSRVAFLITSVFSLSFGHRSRCHNHINHALPKQINH